MINADEITITLRRDELGNVSLIPYTDAFRLEDDASDEDIREFNAILERYKNFVCVFFDAEYKGNRAVAYFPVSRDMLKDRPDFIDGLEPRARFQFVELFSSNQASVQ